MKSFLRDYLQNSLHCPIHIRIHLSSLSFQAVHSNSHYNHQISDVHGTSVQSISSNGSPFPNLLSPHVGCTIRGKKISACKAFDTIPKNSLDFDTNAGYSIIHFTKTWSSGLELDQFNYGNALSACALIHSIDFGEQIFSLVIKNGFFGNGYVITGLIDLFCKVGKFDKGLQVFEENIGNNVVCWNAIIAGSVKNDNHFAAIDLFRKMVSKFCMPNGFTFSSVLNACASSEDLELGRVIHGWVIKCGIKDDIFVNTCIVDVYSKCDNMDDAVKEFWTMPTRNVVSWTTVISGFVRKDDAYNAVKYFNKMINNSVEVNKYTLTSILLACSRPFMVKETMQIHCWTVKNGLLFNDSTVREAFISTYAKFGYTDVSNMIFEEMGSMKSSSTWSIMVSSLAQNQNLNKASEHFSRSFHEGFKPDSVCTSSIISITDNIDYGNQLHSYALKVGLVFNAHVASALFTMYSKCGSIEHSYSLFAQMNEKDVVSWTSMISGFALHGRNMEAFQLFRETILEGLSSDQTTICAILMACSQSEFLIKGKEIHAYALRLGFENDTAVGSSLVSMYLKCKSLASATRVFVGVRCKDQTMWSALISGYASNNYNKEALKKVHQMLKLGFELDCVLVSSILGVCADLSKPIIGEQLHSYGIKKGFILNLSISSALVSIYSKCGNIEDSCKLFNEIRCPDVVTWTAIIDGYAQHGRGLDALDIFEKMKDAEIKPDSVAFLSILTACNHNGLVEEGLSYFNSMKNEYGIEPEKQHYASVVDLLGRSGRLKEAKDFIDKMPVEPDWLVWSSLLSACRVHRELELGKIAANKVSFLAPRDSNTFISSSNICAEIGDWEEVERIRSSMKDVGLKKDVGLSVL